MSTSAKNFNLTDAEQILFKQTLLVCTKRQVFPNVGLFYGENPLKYTFPLLMMELTMVVVFTQVIRYLLKPLRQPRVVSEILGGIIVGRSALSSSSRFRQYVFPTDAVFVLKNIGLIGFMYFLFIEGVKTDVRLIRKGGRKQWILVSLSVAFPLVFTVLVGISLRSNGELSKIPSIIGVSALFSVTAFPVTNPIIRELNLMSSEVGRLAVSTTLITVLLGINMAVIFESAQQGTISGISAFSSFLSFVLFTLAIFAAFRPAMFWIVRTTPQGKPIAEIYVIAILLCVMVCGLLADSFGMALCNGPLWLGLAIPDGPPLGAILVEKSETIVHNFLMPLGFVFVGMVTDLSALSNNWSVMQPYLILTCTAIIVKLISTFIATHLISMPTKDGLALSLIISLRGQMELLLLIRFMDLRVLTSSIYAMMVMIIVVVNAISTPLISILYNPTRPYMVNKRRTIQHTPQNSELRVLACFSDDRSMVGLIKLLELSNSAVSAPICIHAVQLIELIAQANPLLIEHNEDVIECEETSNNSLHRALEVFKESRRQDFEIHHYTIMTAKRTMYQDICELALRKKASLILLPFDQGLAPISTASDTIQQNVRQVNNDVLEHAPCSVAIFSNMCISENNLGSISQNSSDQDTNVMVLFLGGADSREALAYADRISVNPNVCLSVIRFLSREERGDNKMEKKLDDGLITWFWVKHEANSRVVYREVIVENGEETISAIQNLTNDECDIFIVGRKQGINPLIIQGISDWNENNELGPVGDFIASSELGRKASLLVMQQQILRG